MDQFVATTPTPVSSFTHGSLTPMNLSATQWQHRNITCPPPELCHHIVQGVKKTTLTEKAWRRANGSCDFCGEPRHAFVTYLKKQQQQLQYPMRAAALSSPHAPPTNPQQPLQQALPPVQAGFQ